MPGRFNSTRIRHIDLSLVATRLLWITLLYVGNRLPLRVVLLVQRQLPIHLRGHNTGLLQHTLDAHQSTVHVYLHMNFYILCTAYIWKGASKHIFGKGQQHPYHNAESKTNCPGTRAEGRPRPLLGPRPSDCIIIIGPSF